MDFLDLLPTLISCNFFSTEPILKISDVFSRWESNSFISAVSIAQNKTGVPSYGYLWTTITGILKILKKAGFGRFFRDVEWQALPFFVANFIMNGRFLL